MRQSTSFINDLRARAARTSTGASATRGQGAGVSAAARRFLANLNVRDFATPRRSLFESRLDEATKRLTARLPVGSRNWGLARKVLNIFLREVLYTTYLAKYSRIGKAEQLLELPLDSITAKRLHEHAGRKALPRWKGVKHLDKASSDLYQRHAQLIACERKIARVHLDVHWWGRRDE
jgi:hypothetical protein